MLAVTRQDVWLRESEGRPRLKARPALVFCGRRRD